LTLAIVLALIVGMGLFYWVIFPLKGIGIAGGQGAPGSSGFSAVESMLRRRFFAAVVGGLAVQAACCRLLQIVLLKGLT
jgi:hypothetical protein